jgi:hypothetical protein
MISPAFPLLAAFALTLAPARASSAQAGSTAVVVQLYRDFAWEAVFDEPVSPGRALLEQPRDALLRYFDDSLTSLILRDRSCAARTRGICRLDWDPIWASQDPGGYHSIRISATTDSAVVAVSFRDHQGSLVTLSYRMSRTMRGWRVQDIVDGAGHSLLAVLERAE